MLLQINQYFPNLGMILIETLFSVIVLLIIVRIANNYLLQEEYISLKKKNLSTYLAILIAVGSTYGLRSLIAILGYFIEFFILLNTVYFFFAIMASLFYIFFILFLRKFEKKQANNSQRKAKVIKRGILIVGASWATAFIFISTDLLGIPVGDFLPTDILEPSYDVFLLGFEWAIFTLIFDYALITLINRLRSVEKRIPKEVFHNSTLFSGILAFGIWSIQLVIVELYLSRLFNITLYEQDVRILIVVVSATFFLSFFVSLKRIFLPKASKLSALKLKEIIQSEQEKKIEIESKIRERIILEVEDLTTYFYTEEGTVQAIEGISFEIFEGEVLGFVGETGCGKSVTALSVLNLIQPPGKIIRGKVKFNDIDLTKKSEREILPYRGNEITMIFQDPLNSLNPVFKIGDQISEVLLLHKENELLVEASNGKNSSIFSVARKSTENLLKELNIPDPKAIYDRYPHELSGGMRQRVQIAMALACSPKLLIADEPTTALDVTIQNQILKLMKELKAKFNTAILFITHDLGIISKMCDRIAVMYSGRIVEYGNKRQLFSKSLHPYTKKLISSVPIVGKRRESLEIIPGSVPNLIYPPSGCRFHPRCDFRFEPCDKITPKRIEVEQNYFVCCHLYDPEYNPSQEGII
jgi:peptide/nickel transport system ATP-binding protein